MPRGVINSLKQRLSHPLCRTKVIEQWAVDPDPFLTSTTSAKIGKTTILCFSQKLDLGASASVAKSLFHWLRERFMMLKRILRIQIL